MKTIGIFKSACPQGWVRLTAWDGKFIRGNAAYGQYGGAAQHSHTVSYPSTVSGASTPESSPLEGVNYPRRYYVPAGHTHTLVVPQGNSSEQTNIPQCIDVVFCYVEG